jgi:hypothetical protein
MALGSIVSRDGVFAEGLYCEPSIKKLSRILFKKFFAEDYSEALRQRLHQRPST